MLPLLEPPCHVFLRPPGRPFPPDAIPERPPPISGGPPSGTGDPPELVVVHVGELFAVRRPLHVATRVLADERRRPTATPHVESAPVDPAHELAVRRDLHRVDGLAAVEYLEGDVERLPGARGRRRRPRPVIGQLSDAAVLVEQMENAEPAEQVDPGDATIALLQRMKEGTAE